MAILLIIGSFPSCNKSGKDAYARGKLPGHIYFSWADEGVQRINMNSREKSLILPPDTKRNGFDVSNDKERILVLTDIQGDQEHEELKLINATNEKVTWSQKIPVGDHSGFKDPRLSNDGNFILAASFLPDRIIVINLKQAETHVLTDLRGKKFNEAIWLPDGDILLCTDDGMYRSSIPFDQVTLIKEISFDLWHSPSVSPDGKRIAFVGGNHIQVMQADGTGMVQVSASNGKEGAPAFSPDGRFLAVGLHQFSGGAGTWGNYHDLYVFPADGKTHTLEEGKNSGEVIRVIPKNQNDVQAFNNKIRWR